MRGLCDIASVGRPERSEVSAGSRLPLIVAGSGTGLVAASFLAEAFERVRRAGWGPIKASGGR